MRRRLSRVVTVGVTVLLIGWVIGVVASDRWWWSQWLFWLPTPLVAMTCIAGLGVAIRRKHRRSTIAWSLATLLVVGRLTFVEHHFFGSQVSGAISIAHWNLTHADPGDPRRYAEAITMLDADVVILTNAGYVLGDERVRAWSAPPRVAIGGHPFTVISRQPILEFRTLIAAKGGVRVHRLVVEANGPLTLWLLDLPSDPRVGRMALMERVRELLGKAGEDNRPPDLIVGDLNVTRGSAALRHLAPKYRHAYDLAGRGWGASFPRQLPLYHIDHVLAAPDLAVTMYRIDDPGIGMHCVQVVELDRTPGLTDEELDVR
jgi:endonuclease/exonuclease/phosphatase (EEP) superfamily protein YafD